MLQKSTRLCDCVSKPLKIGKKFIGVKWATLFVVTTRTLMREDLLYRGSSWIIKMLALSHWFLQTQSMFIGWHTLFTDRYLQNYRFTSLSDLIRDTLALTMEGGGGKSIETCRICAHYFNKLRWMLYIYYSPAFLKTTLYHYFLPLDEGDTAYDYFDSWITWQGSPT